MGCQEKYVSVALICRFSTHFVHFSRESKANQNVIAKTAVKFCIGKLYFIYIKLPLRISSQP